MKNARVTTKKSEESLNVIMSYVGIGIIIAIATITTYNIIIYGISAAAYNGF